jgi:hypothetical protein
MERRSFLKTALVAGVAGAQNLAVAHSVVTPIGSEVIAPECAVWPRKTPAENRRGPARRQA